MEFLSRQAWDISAHLIGTRYTTLESLQKELKGNQVLKRHSEKMHGKEKQSCSWTSVIILVQFRLFKDSCSKQEVNVPSAITWQEEARNLSEPYVLEKKNKNKDHFWKHKEVLLYFCILLYLAKHTFCCSHALGVLLRREANTETLQQNLDSFLPSTGTFGADPLKLEAGQAFDLKVTSSRLSSGRGHFELLRLQ